MLRKSLLLTTAFVVAATLLMLPASARPAAVGAGRDSNGEFLRNYACGNSYANVSGYAKHVSSDWAISYWRHVAVSTTGQGETVDRIVVEDGYNNSSENTFSAGIHSNAPSDRPGMLIAAGTGSAHSDCDRITIPIRPTKLLSKTKYWVEETAGPYNSDSSFDEVFWKWVPHSKRKAYVQVHFWSSKSSVSSSTTTPWTRLSGAPYFRLK